MKIGICGFYGKNNLGDDLMAHHLSAILSQNGKNEVIVFSDKRHENVQNGLATGHHLNSDIIVIGGGGIIHPSFWAFKNGGIQKIKDSGKPVVFLNVGVTSDAVNDTEFLGQLKSLQAKWWVRDNKSHQLLQSKDIEASVIPDVSFREGVVPWREEESDSKKLLVFLNSYVFNNLFSKKDVDTFLKAQVNIRTIAKFLDWMSNFGWKISLVPAQTGGEIDDRIISGIVYGISNNKANISWVTEKMDWNYIIKEIASSDMVLSMRYHASTIAIAAGVPLVDIVHHDKNHTLLKDLRLENICAFYEELSHKKLVEATQYSENYLNYQKNIANFRSEAHVKWQGFDLEWESYIKGLEHE